jgi:hypothetical protein
VGLEGATEGALESAALGGALGALAVADIRAAPGSALRGVRFDDAGHDHEAAQVGLGRPPAAADAAPLRNAYGVPLLSA